MTQFNNKLLIDADYIRGCLDARGIVADDETVNAALNAWISSILEDGSLA